MLRFSDVPGQRETPVQGLGFPDGPVPDDGERLYSHPQKKKYIYIYIFLNLVVRNFVGFLF